jgi:hypothetical protein
MNYADESGLSKRQPRGFAGLHQGIRVGQRDRARFDDGPSGDDLVVRSNTRAVVVAFGL